MQHQQQQRRQRQHDNEDSEESGDDGRCQSGQNVHHQAVPVRSVPRPLQRDHRGTAQRRVQCCFEYPQIDLVSFRIRHAVADNFPNEIKKIFMFYGHCLDKIKIFKLLVNKHLINDFP